MEAHMRQKDEETKLMGKDDVARPKCEDPINFFVFMVSRAGLEPATTALKDQCMVYPHRSHWRRNLVFAVVTLH
jgi:hypothetical protein